MDYADILIKNAIIITMDKNKRVIDDGAIAIVDDKIVAVDKTSRVEQKYKSEKVICGKGRIVLPGFINTHDHLFQTLLRSMGDDMNLNDWWPNTVGPITPYLTKKDMYYAALTGCIELIRSGVTANLDYQYANPRPLIAEGVLEAFLQIGIRGVLGRGYSDVDMFDFGLPDDIIESTEQALSDTETLLKRWHGKANGRIKIWLAPGAPFANSDENLAKTREFANKYGIGITMHIQEARAEVDTWKEHFGTTPVQYYAKKVPELFGPDFISVHSVWLEPEDIKIFAKTGVTVSHNTNSNMYLSSGVAPVPEMLKQGIPVSLGVDGAASNNSKDFFEMLKNTVLMHKVHTLNPTILTSVDVLEMATMGGARSLMMEKEIGSLEVGKKADLSIFDYTMANMVPLNRPMSQIVYCGKAANIETVIIDGRIIMENRVIKTVNEEEVLRKTQKITEDIHERAGRGEYRRELFFK